MSHETEKTSEGSTISKRIISRCSCGMELLVVYNVTDEREMVLHAVSLVTSRHASKCGGNVTVDG